MVRGADMRNTTKEILEDWVRRLAKVNDAEVNEIRNEMIDIISNSKIESAENYLTGCEKDIYNEMQKRIKEGKNGRDNADLQGGR
jgi:hypothetical protein